MNIPDSGIPGDLFHLAQKAHHQANQKGENAGVPQLFMGGALVYIGATLLMKAIKHDDVRMMLGLGSGGRSR